MRHEHKAGSRRRTESYSKADGLLEQLEGKTPAEIKAYLDTNVTNLDQANVMFTKILVLLQLALR